MARWTASTEGDSRRLSTVAQVSSDSGADVGLLCHCAEATAETSTR